MRLKVTEADGDVRSVFVAAAATIEVDPFDGDQRTQAERHADNALQAARLRRVEAELDKLIKATSDAANRNVVGVRTPDVLKALRRVREAPVT